MLHGILLTILFILAALCSKSITTLFHELGHAIPALIFTKKDVIVFVGSYGETEESSYTRLGRLHLFIKFNFLWYKGQCGHQPVDHVWKRAAILLGGPLASISIATVLFTLTYSYNLSDVTKVLAYLFMMMASWDFISNIIPSGSPMKQADGNHTYNDGYQLRQLWMTVQYPERFGEGLKLYNDSKYQEAGLAFEEVLLSSTYNEHIMNLAMDSFIQSRDFNKIIDCINLKFRKKNLEEKDFYNLGYAHTQNRNFHEAVEAYNKCLQINYYNKEALNNRGDLYNKLGRYEKAFIDFTQLVDYDPANDKAWTNRGFTKMHMGNMESAKDDLQRALKIAPNNPHTLRNYGLCCFQMKNLKPALEFLKKAKEIDPSLPNIDQDIEMVEGLIN